MYSTCRESYEDTYSDTYWIKIMITVKVITTNIAIINALQCSRKCGGGSKYRKVRCQQLLSLGQMIDKTEVNIMIILISIMIILVSIEMIIRSRI